MTGGRVSTTGVVGLAYARLSQLERTWDPTHLFRHNQNIAPAPEG